MKIQPLISSELQMAESIALAAFAPTPDSDLSDWLSFTEMGKSIDIGRGLCLLAFSETNEPAGIIYAQQENPINGREGLEKWVIVIAAVDPRFTGQGIGTALLKELEQQLKDKGAVKLFVYTNKDDEEVIHFYRKNDYEDAGWIRDYQYGKDNSAVFSVEVLVSIPLVPSFAEDCYAIVRLPQLMRTGVTNI